MDAWTTPQLVRSRTSSLTNLDLVAFSFVFHVVIIHISEHLLSEHLHLRKQEKTMSNKIKIIIVGPLLLFCDCFVFNTLQSAKLLSKNELAIAPECATVLYTHSNNLKEASNSLGLQCGYGFSGFFNLYARYSRLQLSDYGVGYNYISIDPKFRLLEDVIAFSLPAGFYFGEDVDYSNSVNLAPSLFFTFTINKYVDLTAAPELIMFLPSFSTLAAVNANACIHCFSNRILVVPEVGYAVRPHAGDRFFYLSVGMTYKIVLVK